MKQTNKPASTNGRKATTDRARETQLINAAVNLAEKQLLEGTASSAVIVHYLKLGTERQRLENDILMEQRKLVEAKTEQLRSAQHMEELYANAIKAMGQYHGDYMGDENEDPEL